MARGAFVFWNLEAFKNLVLEYHEANAKAEVGILQVAEFEACMRLFATEVLAAYDVYVLVEGQKALPENLPKLWKAMDQ